MDIWAPRRPYVEKRKIAPHRNHPNVREIGDGHVWSFHHIKGQWFGTYCLHCPGIHWVVLNETQGLCGTDFWPWLPPAWLGCCTLAFTLAHGRILSTVTKIANLPFLKARWTHSVFHWYDHLATALVPSTVLDDVIAHIESLSTFTQHSLKNSHQRLSLLNTEMSLMRKAVLQNWMALDIITASQGGTCAINKTECHVFMSLLMWHLY